MRRKPTARITLAVAFALAASLVLAGGRPAEDAAPEAAQTAQPAPATARRAVPTETPAAASAGEGGTRVTAQPAPGESGLRVRLDPQTGEILEHAPDPADEKDAARFDGPRRWLNTYGDDLVQEPLPGGGFRVDLRGRFQSSVVATIDPETDAVAIDCVTTAIPEEAANDE